MRVSLWCPLKGARALLSCRTMVAVFVRVRALPVCGSASESRCRKRSCFADQVHGCAIGGRISMNENSVKARTRRSTPPHRCSAHEAGQREEEAGSAGSERVETEAQRGGGAQSEHSGAAAARENSARLPARSPLYVLAPHAPLARAPRPTPLVPRAPRPSPTPSPTPSPSPSAPLTLATTRAASSTRTPPTDRPCCSHALPGRAPAPPRARPTSSARHAASSPQRSWTTASTPSLASTRTKSRSDPAALYPTHSRALR